MVAEFDLAAIDAGATHCAVAFYSLFGKLRHLCEAPTYAAPNIRCARAVYEIPQADGRAAPIDDLIRTAVGGAKVAAWLAPEVVEYQPRQWKGSTPKPVHHRRAWAVLTDAERAILGGTLTSHAIDKACERGARNRWQKDGKLYYSAREFPTVGGLKITHDLLDAAALGLYDLGRIK